MVMSEVHCSNRSCNKWHTREHFVSTASVSGISMTRKRTVSFEKRSIYLQ